MANVTQFGNALELDEILPALAHKTQRHWLFSSVEALADHVSTLDENKAGCRSGWRNDRSFTGTKTMQDAITFARDGWQEGADNVAKLRDRINAETPIGPRIVRYDVAGSIVHVGRYLSGNPMHMKRVDTAKLRRKPIITLVTELGLSCMVDAEELQRRAAACAAIVDAIEAAGYSCQVLATCDMQNESTMRCEGPSRFSYRVAFEVKAAGQHVDIARLAFSMGHPSVFRRFSFAIVGSDDESECCHSSQGYPFNPDKTDLPHRQVYYLPKLGNTAQVEQGGYVHQYKFSNDDRTVTEGLPALIDALVEQGCPAFRKEG